MPTHRLAACANEPPSCGKLKNRSCGVAGAQSPPSLRWVDYLARVHLAARVEDVLELLERPDELLTEHPAEQLAAGLAVAVLAGQRTPVAED
jgi:hypothetical protein